MHGLTDVFLTDESDGLMSISLVCIFRALWCRWRKSWVKCEEGSGGRQRRSHTAKFQRCLSQNKKWIRENHFRVSKGNQYPIGWSNTNREPDYKEGDEVTENERERGRRKRWMKGNCIRKKRRPEGRKWLEEKRLIADREGVGEMDRVRKKVGWVFIYSFHSIHTDTPSVSIQSVCVSPLSTLSR